MASELPIFMASVRATDLALSLTRLDAVSRWVHEPTAETASLVVHFRGAVDRAYADLQAIMAEVDQPAPTQSEAA